MKCRRGSDSSGLVPKRGGIEPCFCTGRLRYAFLMRDGMRRWPQIKGEWKEEAKAVRRREYRSNFSLVPWLKTKLGN